MFVFYRAPYNNLRYDGCLEKTILIDASNQASNDVNIEKLWAQKKIAYLEIQYKLNGLKLK
jgi:hypothetical protein